MRDVESMFEKGSARQNGISLAFPNSGEAHGMAPRPSCMVDVQVGRHTVSSVPLAELPVGVAEWSPRKSATAVAWEGSLPGL